MLEKGQALSHYRLVDKIGEGGMGEVWRAKDTRLDREVAVKFLPDVVARDEGRLDRFAREAKLLASLNHSGIATIHDIDEHEGIRFLVMELVPGEDLAQALEKGALPLSDALDVALQIARAVEVAHGQGVVHRDLKPANVKRASGSQIKVLDFGLAKALEPDPTSGEQNVSLSPTMTSAGTVAGMILGTAAYMSPEQARGRPIDKRTDIWSFGVVLYELLTGDNPFRGETVADSVGAIMHRDPDLQALPPETPAAIRRLLRRCLTRERAQRLHDIADVRIELEEAIAHPEIERAAVETAQVAAPASRMPWIVVALLVPLVASLAWWVGSREDPPVPEATRQFELVLDSEVHAVEVSPDGSRIAYRVDNEIFIRSLDASDPRKIADVTEPGSFGLFWSPDGRSLGFSNLKGEIRRIDLAGGAPTVLTTLSSPVQYAQWGDDGYIYYSEFQSGISRLPESGGASEPYLERHDDMLDYHGMSVLPEGRGIVTIPHLGEDEGRNIFIERRGEEPRIVFESDATINWVRYDPTGHLFFKRQKDPVGLWALPFSLSRLEATGPPFLVVPDLAYASFSAEGDLVYRKTALQSGEREQQIVWSDRSGQIVERLDTPVYQATRPVLSPDGSRIAIVAEGAGRVVMDKMNLWVIDLERGTSTKLTDGRVRPATPVWSADGSRIAFQQESSGTSGALVAIHADGTGVPERLIESESVFFFSLDRDWSIAAFMTGSIGEQNGFGITIERPGDPSSRSSFVDGPDLDVAPEIHPDGSWLAYMSGTFANMETFVRPFPAGEGQWKVSVGMGGLPIWSADGTRLYYAVREDDQGVNRLMEVAFDGSGATPELGAPQEILTWEGEWGIVSPDGQGRFMYVVDVESEDDGEKPDPTGIVLIENWRTRFVD
jgi:serine/threonine-protein kinase